MQNSVYFNFSRKITHAFLTDKIFKILICPQNIFPHRYAHAAFPPSPVTSGRDVGYCKTQLDDIKSNTWMMI